VLSGVHQIAPGHIDPLRVAALVAVFLAVWKLAGALPWALLRREPWALGFVLVMAALIHGLNLEGLLMLRVGEALFVRALWTWLTERVWLRYGWGDQPC
jgi:hypothetical protein